MSSIARSFVSIEKRFDKIGEKLSQHDSASTILIKMHKEHQDQTREQREEISSLEINDIKQERAIDILNKGLKLSDLFSKSVKRFFNVLCIKKTIFSKKC